MLLESKIREAARTSVPVSIKSFTLSKETEAKIDDVLKLFLEELGQGVLFDRISYCVKELTTNAKKANTKRIYFEEKNLDITNSDDYKIGVATFMSDTVPNIEHYLALQQEAGLHILVEFQIVNGALVILVKNNSEISEMEQLRIYDRIARSRGFDSVEEILSSVMDDTEGAGLGLVILTVMLRKLGLGNDAFNIDLVDGYTVASLCIPMAEKYGTKLKTLSRGIVEHVDKLPQLPDNILRLQELIDNSDVEIATIARQVGKDPTLTADLLRTVNSAQFMLSKKVSNIFDAVKFLGLSNLRNQLYAYGTERILPEGDRTIWDHSYRTAFYAYNIARNSTVHRGLMNDAYVGGVLHDIGKLVLSELHPSLSKKLEKLAGRDSESERMLENLASGLNHAEVGGMIAHKWNFSESLVSVVTYHHEPRRAPKEHETLVDTVYLANALANYHEGKLRFDQVDPNILSAFGISSSEQFITIIEKLNSFFDH